MSSGFRGLLWALTYIILEAAQAVFLGSLLQRIDAFIVGLLIFGTSSILALLWVVLQNRVELGRASAHLTTLFGVNLTVAGSWIAYLLSVQLIEPTVAFTILSGAVPLVTIVAANVGFPEARAAENRLERIGYWAVFAAILMLGIMTVAGYSGFVRGGVAAALAGVGLAAVSGGFIAGMILYCHRLDLAGVGPMAQYGLRFVFFLVLCAGGFIFQLEQKEPVSSFDIVSLIVFGYALMAFPIFAMQKAVQLVSPITLAAITALGPAFVFLFQLLEGRVAYAHATLIGLAVYSAGSLLLAMGSGLEAEAPRPVIRSARIEHTQDG